MDVSVKALHYEYEGHDVPDKEEEGECEDDDVGWAALKALYEMVEAQCSHGDGETEEDSMDEEGDFEVLLARIVRREIGGMLSFSSEALKLDHSLGNLDRFWVLVGQMGYREMKIGPQVTKVNSIIRPIKGSRIEAQSRAKKGRRSRKEDTSVCEEKEKGWATYHQQQRE